MSQLILTLKEPFKTLADTILFFFSKLHDSLCESSTILSLRQFARNVKPYILKKKYICFRLLSAAVVTVALGVNGKIICAGVSRVR